MNRKLVCLGGVLLFFLGFPAVSSATTWWGEIWYAGFVSEVTDEVICADTLIVLVNPNGNKPIEAKLFVYDKKGDLIVGKRFLDGGKATVTIPPRGYGWRTLSSIVPASSNPFGGLYGTKYVFRIRIGWPDGVTPPPDVLAPVVEVKEVLYGACSQSNYIWDPNSMKSWSETSLGGDNGPGFHWIQ